MAAPHAHQRRLHRRVAALQLEVAPRYEATACFPGEKKCHHREAKETKNPTDDDNWLTFLFPDKTTTSTSSPSVPPVHTSHHAPVLPTGSSSSVTSKLRSKTTKSTLFSKTAVGAANSASASPASASAHNTGTVIGGIGGGVIGFVILLALVAFILRRFRRNKEDLVVPFNSAEFRKSAVLLHDPPTHQDTINAGFNSRPPPTMSERRIPTFGTPYPVPAPIQTPIIETYDIYSPHSPSSANPFISPAVTYTPSPFSPSSSPITDSPGPGSFLSRSNSSAAQTTVSRKSSGKTIRGPERQAQYPVVEPVSDYVDLSRSSVSPFQAAQYVEISKHIGSDVPSGLSSPLVDEELKSIRVHDILDTPPPLPEKDRSSSGALSEELDISRFSAVTDQSDVLDTAGLDFPVPPSPSLSSVTRYRVESMPPMLPEIRVESRASFATSSLSPFGTYDFPVSVPTSAVSSTFSSGVSATAQIITIPPKTHFDGQGSFPSTPSPQGSSFTLSSPAPGSTFDSVEPAPRPAPSKLKEVYTRPETVYDLEDVYGGI